MFIVLTAEHPVKEETQILNALFEQGLETLHLRKPDFDISGYRKMLEGINTRFHNRIMLHQFHELSEEFDLKGIHFQEMERKQRVKDMPTLVQTYHDRGKKVSSSFHVVEDIQNCHAAFDYVLLSPVFDAVSKTNYPGKAFDVHQLSLPVIGLGGMTVNTIPQAMELGYSGIGVLGSIWNAVDPVSRFVEIQKAYQSNFSIHA